MKHSRLTWLSIVLISAFWVFFGSSTVSANVLPEGMVIGDESGLNAKKNGEYFVNITDVMPGQKWDKTISLINMEKNDSYKLTMLISKPEVSGSLNLSEAIQMTITYDGKEVYRGPASGVSSSLDLQSTPLDLGIFSAGDSRALNVHYEISGEYTEKDFNEKNIMDNVWTFYAVKTTEKPKLPTTKGDGSTPVRKGTLPTTGEIRRSMIIVCISLFILLIILFVWKKNRDNKQLD